MFNKKLFLAQIIIADMTIKSLAEALGIDESTMYRKINDDGRFTRKEINSMIVLLKIDNPKEIFFAEEVA